MAGSSQYTVGTLPTLLAAAPPSAAPGPCGWFSIANGTAATIYLGGPSVSSGNGCALAASGTLAGFVWPSDQIYGITAAGTSDVSVFQTGV